MEDLKVKEFLTITEACRILSLSRWTIWRAIKNEELIAAKIGRRVLIRHSDLDMLFKIEINSGPEKIKEEQRPNDPTNTDTGNFNIADSYTLTEVQNKYGISESALQHLIKRNNVPKIKQGWFAYVPKKVIDTLLT
ncbi:MAG: helix-turn-helix domain-containing protein [Bacteroidota bacterium]